MVPTAADGANRPVTGGGWRKMLTASSSSGVVSETEQAKKVAARGIFGWKDKGGGQTAADVIGALRWRTTPRGVPTTVARGGDRN